MPKTIDPFRRELVVIPYIQRNNIERVFIRHVLRQSYAEFQWPMCKVELFCQKSFVVLNLVRREALYQLFFTIARYFEDLRSLGEPERSVFDSLSQPKEESRLIQQEYCTILPRWAFLVELFLASKCSDQDLQESRTHKAPAA